MTHLSTGREDNANHPADRSSRPSPPGTTRAIMPGRHGCRAASLMAPSRRSVLLSSALLLPLGPLALPVLAAPIEAADRWNQQQASAIEKRAARDQSAAAGDPASSNAAKQISDALDRMRNNLPLSVTGDADRDFAAVMVVLRRAEIEIADVVLRYGFNSEIRKLAQVVAVTSRRQRAFLENYLGGAGGG